MSKELPKTYDPKQVENSVYQLWEKSGFFNPDKLPKRHKKPYSIVIPPPNITGSLHMGHALNAASQDILIRWKRMQGYKTLWLPGIDHASIATQNVVEKELKKEGLTRFDLGREKFLERVWQWKEKYGNIILAQFKKLGSSCDWSRTRFTMDKDYVKAVETVFLYYYKKGWIYQGKKVVNWCPRCQTSLSDLELEYKEEKSYLWYIKYPLVQSSKLKVKSYIVVATTRPETMLGDTAVAANPKDKRYKDLIGKTAILPIQNRKIPIIADVVVDSKFGTGAVKITPSHDPVDWEIGQRHDLGTPIIINEKGIMAEESKICNGLRPVECREKVIQILTEQNLIEKIEDYTHSVPHCYRCNTIIEPLPSRQWFLKMDKLAKIAIEAIKKRKIKFIPKRFEKPYFDWLKNIKDWCISRQLWWGHKIPLEGETDVLDTWFSSALWPFAIMGWPQKTRDLKTFYPTSVLSTARDIINLWVARMIFSGIEFMGKEPFKSVFIHPTVLTSEGKKMSKSLGTGVDPLELIKKYGADATRFGIVYQIMGGQDLRFKEEIMLTGRKFCNKIWNATRFVLMSNPSRIYANIDTLRSPHKLTRMKNLTLADKRIFKALDKITKSVNKNLESFRFGQAAHALYDFFWHDFCDIYIEKSKKQNDEKTKKILLYLLLNSLKLLHPFLPFITEEIYQKLPLKDKKKCLMVETWPQ